MDRAALKPGMQVRWFMTNKSGGIVRGTYHPATVIRLASQRVTVLTVMPDGEKVLRHVEPENLTRAQEVDSETVLASSR